MRRLLPLLLPASLPALLALGALATPTAARAELPPLIARELLFGNPERTLAKISPDGKWLAWLAPDGKGVLQVMVKPVAGGAPKVMTADKKRGIRRYDWAEDNRTLLYQQDLDGDENWHLYGVELATGHVRDLTPWQGVRAELLEVEARHPDVALVTMNLRDPKVNDVYRIDLKSGAATLDTQNPGDVAAWIVDGDLVVRGAQVSLPDGGTELRVRDGAKRPWRTLLKAGFDETVRLAGFTPDGKSVYLEHTLGSDTTRLVERSLAGGKDKVLAARDQVDVGAVMVHPTRHHVQAVSFEPGRSEWQVIDPAVKADFAAIAKLADGTFRVVSRDHADQSWVIGFTGDHMPGRYYLYDRASKRGTLLFSAQPKLDEQTLADTKPVVVPARDGLSLPAYLTLPPGVPARALPLVLFVHGGPWARDNWGFISTAQWLANRGYAVLQVNYRGSTGFGKKFLHAGDRQWGLKMHDDLVDAVAWAVKEGYADAKRVAVFGGSYGGYAALAGAAFTPDLFRCAVDIVGPSNLTTLIHSIPPYWATLRATFDRRMGNVDNPADAELIRRASPLFSADKIKIPMLIGQGANDPRVNQAESEQIVAAIEKQGGRATYVLYPDEGHGFARPANRVDFNARAEKFLHDNLGGRFEPLGGAKEPGSTAQVREIGRQVSAR